MNKYIAFLILSLFLNSKENEAKKTIILSKSSCIQSFPLDLLDEVSSKKDSSFILEGEVHLGGVFS